MVELTEDAKNPDLAFKALLKQWDEWRDSDPEKKLRQWTNIFKEAPSNFLSNTVAMLWDLRSGKFIEAGFPDRFLFTYQALHGDTGSFLDQNRDRILLLSSPTSQRPDTDLRQFGLCRTTSNHTGRPGKSMWSFELSEIHAQQLLEDIEKTPDLILDIIKNSLQARSDKSFLSKYWQGSTPVESKSLTIAILPTFEKSNYKLIYQKLMEPPLKFSKAHK